MGNRAVIIEFGKQDGIYLHWNGGRDSIEPMLYYAKNLLSLDLSTFKNTLKKVEFIAACCGFDPTYADNYSKLDCDNWDNGVYVINKNYEIVSRMFFNSSEQKEYNFIDFLVFIDENMPKKYQRGKDFIFKYLASKEVETETLYANDNTSCKIINYEYIQRLLQAGDIIYYHGEFKTLVGKNHEDKEYLVNGSDRSKDAFYNYTESYEENSNYKLDTVKDFDKIRKNPNSYLHYTYKTNHNGEYVKALDDNNFRIVNEKELNDIIAEFEIRNAQQETR